MGPSPSASISSTPAASTSASISSAVTSATPPDTKDVKKAKEAELTPIVPTPADPHRPAFQLYSEIDIPVLVISAAFASARMLRTQQAYCAPRCDPAELNGLDRQTAGFWNPSWAVVSDIGALSLMAGSATVLAADEGVLVGLNDAVVVAQSALLATAGPTMLTIAAGRPRPFLYGDAAPADVRTGADAGLSFISSHTSVSFAIVTSTYMAMKRRHPDAVTKWLVLGIGVPIASTVAAARVMAGRHFVTDVVLGALVGGAMGIVIPALHDSPVRVLPRVDKNTAAIAVEVVL